MKKTALILLWCCMLFLFVSASTAETADEVVAIVNDEVITFRELEQTFAPQKERLSRIYTGDELEKKLAEARRRSLEVLIENQLILEKAKKLDVPIGDMELSEKMQSVRDKFPSEKVFKERLQEEGLSLKQLEQRYKERMMIERLVQAAVNARVSVTHTDIFDYYQKHKDTMTKKDAEYTIRHIVVKVAENRTRQEARAVCEDILASCVAGVSFEEMAMEYSDGANKENGGLVRNLKAGSLKKELSDVLATLNPGEVSGVIDTDLGCHLIQLVEVTRPEPAEFKDVEPVIQRMLYKQRYEKRYREWIDELKKDAYIEIKREL
ncbi:MAG: peptidylprolyl isomerase [Candidatus Omnitrophica bacterium]|nr:peptidylprolyl isomerase [Candidatus Omnitrophota bacterium]